MCMKHCFCTPCGSCCFLILVSSWTKLLGPSKNCVTRGRGRGVPNILIERVNKPEKGGGGVNVEMGELALCHYFTYSSITFTVWGKSKVSSLLSWPCKILIQIFILLKHCIFLIHSGSLLKMLTALFKLVWNTQKTTPTNFFEGQGKILLNIEKVLVKISEEQPWLH